LKARRLGDVGELFEAGRHVRLWELRVRNIPVDLRSFPGDIPNFSDIPPGIPVIEDLDDLALLVALPEVRLVDDERPRKASMIRKILPAASACAKVVDEATPDENDLA
jgi:hypothetical protein